MSGLGSRCPAERSKEKICSKNAQGEAVEFRKLLITLKPFSKFGDLLVIVAIEGVCLAMTIFGCYDLEGNSTVSLCNDVAPKVVSNVQQENRC